jgi:DNA-binding transcriptional LysR family regulator
LNIPVSTLSRQITLMEQQINVKLFQRTTRQVTLTEAGEALLHAVKQPLNQINDALTHIKNNQLEISGTVRLATTHFLAETMLPAALTSLLQTYPNLRLELWLDEQVIDVRTNAIDLVLRVGKIKDQSLIGRQVAETIFHEYAAPYWQECSTIPHIAYADEEHIHHANLVSGNMRVNYAAALAGAGKAFLPQALCADDVAAGRLIQLSTKPIARYPIYLLYASREHQPQKVQAVLNALHQNLPCEA